MKKVVDTQGQSLLLTRPIEASQACASFLIEKGISCEIAPMMEYIDISHEKPEQGVYNAYIFTSAQGITSFHGDEFDVPVFCVGNKTADTARARGYRRVYNAQGDLEALVALIKEQLNKAARMLYVRGQDVSKDIVSVLDGYDCDEIVSYEARFVDRMPDEICHLIRNGHIWGVSFFSKRTALNFSSLAQKAQLLESLEKIKCLCISQGVVECVHAVSWGEVRAARTPNLDGMYALINEITSTGD